MILHLLATVIFTLTFLYGFFPMNTTESWQIIDPPLDINDVVVDLDKAYPAHFEKVVLIVIDALRNDFITKETMPFTSGRINTKTGCIQNVKVECPTVTMPRIKSLTTGGIPQFIDVILNLGNSGTLKESLLHVLERKNKTIVFYGDDTWLKLFPDIFARSEGTSSFYVNDFTEVDENVTKNLKQELDRKDWDLLILHYLGLDHIGHVYGPYSSLVPHKLKEMDEIIQLIDTALSRHDSRSLILITGDHGMKDSGGHGGSTYPETHVPLVVLGNTCQNGSISQTDIPVNLAVLLGATIPPTSIGLVQKPLLDNLSLQQYLFALRYNNIILISKHNICHNHFELASKFHSTFLQNNDISFAKKASILYENCSQVIYEYSLSSAKQNLGIMLTSVLNLCYIFLDLFNISFKVKERKLYDIFLFFYINILQLLFDYSVFIITMSVLLSWEAFYFCKYLLQKVYETKLNTISSLSLPIVYPFILMSSSFVEEEHQFWYFTLATLIFLKTFNSFDVSYKESLKWILLFMMFRFARNINQTGDKWSSLPDIADWFLERRHHMHMLMFCIFNLLTVFCVSTFLLDKIKFVSICINFLVVLFIFLSNIYVEQKVLFQKYTWFLIFLQIILSFLGYYPIDVVWISVCLLLLKPYNLILIVFSVFASNLFSGSTKDTKPLTLTYIVLGNALYFMQGHSNSLASVDISVGYTALTSYKPLLVGGQILLHTYAFPVLCHLLLLRRTAINVDIMYCILCLCRLSVSIVYFINIYLHRYHIFIWSVFAPKLLIESCHNIVFCSEVLLYYIFIKISKICMKKEVS